MCVTNPIIPRWPARKLRLPFELIEAGPVFCRVCLRVYRPRAAIKRKVGHDRPRGVDYMGDGPRTAPVGPPCDNVLATGEAHSVREFVELAFKEVAVDIVWDGEGVGEKGRDAHTGAVRVEIDPRYFRPTEVDHLVGEASKARKVLGWAPKSTFRGIVSEMVQADLNAVLAERRRSGKHD